MCPSTCWPGSGREEPICPTPSGARYLSRFADIEAALRDVESFRADLGPVTGLGGLEDIPDEQLFLSEITEPRHGQIRRLYNSCFGPHRTRQVETFVRQVCDELVDALLKDEATVVDLHEGYALPIPGRVMAHIMGLPDGDAQHFLDWSTDGSIMTRPATPGVEAGGPPIAAYFRGQLAERAGRADQARVQDHDRRRGRRRRPERRPDRDPAALHDHGRGPHHPGAADPRRAATAPIARHLPPARVRTGA